MISTKKFLNVDGLQKRFVSEFVIASDQHVNVYVHTLNLPTINDLVDKNLYDMIDNSVSFYTAPLKGSLVTLEVATNLEDFGNVISLPAADRADNAANASEQYALEALGYRDQAHDYADAAYNSALDANNSVIKIGNSVSQANNAASNASASATAAHNSEVHSQSLYETISNLESSFVNTATGAIAIAKEALDKSETSIYTSNLALNGANSAISTANNAYQDAINSVSLANNAITTANNALTTANDAYLNSTDAIDKANKATTNATSALTKATSAEETASTALTVATTAEVDAQKGITNAATAQAKATSAYNLASSKGTIYYTNIEPTSPAIDDMWIVIDTGVTYIYTEASSPGSPSWDATHDTILQSEIDTQEARIDTIIDVSLANINIQNTTMQGILDGYGIDIGNIKGNVSTLDTSVLNAQNDADTANNTANTALSTANTANNTANTALSTANTALSTANTAKTTADTAKTTADTANTTANTANTTANTANTTANTAKTTANTANTNATTAINALNGFIYKGQNIATTAGNEFAFRTTSGDFAFRFFSGSDKYVGSKVAYGTFYVYDSSNISFTSSMVSTSTGMLIFPTQNIFRMQGSVTPETDALYTLGLASKRWTTIYASTGSINTSDARSKQQVLPLNEIEKNLAITLKGLIRTFKFNDSVIEKGSDNARIHTGVIAQEVEQAFKDAGLDAFKYSILCYDKWDAIEAQEGQEYVAPTYDEEGNELTPEIPFKETIKAVPAGDRYGVRYEELLCFIIGAM